MGLFKSLKKLTIKKVAKVAAKVAPIAAAVIPGVGPVVAGAIAVAGRIGSKAATVLKTAGDIQEVLGTGPPGVTITDGPASARNYRNRSTIPGLEPKTNWLLWIGAGLAALFLVPKLRKVVGL